MKTTFTFLAAALLLTACSSGPKTVAYGSGEFTYDSAFFENVNGGISAKGDESCWIDLTGDLTTPMASEELQNSVDGNLTLMSDSYGVPQYISFKAGSETVYARVSVTDTDDCTGKLVALAEMNK